jgi:hypothetical protein
MIEYTPQDWYWIIAGDQSKVFSSASGDYVLPSNPAYVAWLATGKKPTRILNEAELGEVLADVRVRPTRATVLDAYKGQHAKRMTDEIQTKALLWCINEIRTLKGEAPLTTGAAIRAFLKDLM